MVLVHGFTGSPAEMRLLAHALHSQGFGVEAPLLAGHGTQLDDLMEIEPRQWLEQIDALVLRLRNQGQRVVVAGLSLGSILALQAGLRHRDVEAVMAYSPPIISGDPRALIAPLLARVLPSVPRPAEDCGSSHCRAHLDLRTLAQSLQRACAGVDPGDATSAGGTAATASGGGQPQGSRDHGAWRGMA